MHKPQRNLVLRAMAGLALIAAPIYLAMAGVQSQSEGRSAGQKPASAKSAPKLAPSLSAVSAAKPDDYIDPESGASDGLNESPERDAPEGPPISHEKVAFGLAIPEKLTADMAQIPVALLVDLNSGRRLYVREPDRRFLPASVTKVMTAYVAFELLAKGRLQSDQLISVGDSAWQEWHNKGSRMFLARGSLVTVDQLLMGITTVSANDACIVLAEGATGNIAGWVALMNAKARELGMKDSHFGTPNGWMDGGQTYFSASDLVRLTDAMLTRYPAYYHRYFGHPGLTWNGITQSNHDPTIGVVPGADGIKTGYTDEARYTFLGSAQRDGRRLVMVLAGAPTSRARARAARSLLEWGFSAWESRPIIASGAEIGVAKVQLGAVNKVRLVAPKAYYTTQPRGVSGAVSMRLIYHGPVMAPITKGDRLAELEIIIGGEAQARLPLVAAENVARGGVLDRMRSGITGFFN